MAISIEISHKHLQWISQKPGPFPVKSGLVIENDPRCSLKITCHSSTGNLQNLEILDLDFTLQLDGVSTTSTVVDSLMKIQAVPVSIF
jgi:hypothetical protein